MATLEAGFLTGNKNNHPLRIRDKEVTELTIDFDKLMGNDFIAAEQEVRAMGEIRRLPYFVHEISGGIGSPMPWRTGRRLP